MGSEDDTVIMPRDAGGVEPPGTGPGGSGPGGPDKRTERLLMIGMIIAVVIIAGLLVLLIRACGGDEPAPQVSTVVETIVETTTVEPETTTAETTEPEPPARGDIRSVNWRSEVGAQPMVREVEDVIYGDLDGDGNDDALVLVRLEGSGAYLDYYVYTYRDTTLTRLFEKREVDHGSVELSPAPRSFVETKPVYAPGDPNCCPSELRLTTYTWSSSAGTFTETNVEVVPNPAL